MRLEEAIPLFTKRIGEDLEEFLANLRTEAEERPGDYEDITPTDIFIWYVESF